MESFRNEDGSIDFQKWMQKLVDLVHAYHPRADLEKLWKGFHLGIQAHEGQKRKSGDPYFIHSMSVAETLVGLRLDVDTIIAGLLHDVVEDTRFELKDLRRDFGEDVALLVDGVTKINEIRYENPEAQQAENYRKMLLTMAKDVRVILIKLADRLHNMTTLDVLSDPRREAIAQETLMVYAPLAHRFGIARIKWELEDLAFKHLFPDEYRMVVNGVDSRRDERETFLQKFQITLRELLADVGIRSEVSGRPKHFYSIWQKMKRYNARLDQIYDLLAVRVLVDSKKDCYHALGVVHSHFTPLHDRLKDYIATPKQNLYQSLHTTVRSPSGALVEVQIRTHDMHYQAEVGIAAHWRYKETGGKTINDQLDNQLKWFREVLEWQNDVNDPREFMKALRTDLFQEEVYVFSPAGDLFKMPQGSTPLDFAFYVHSEVGLHCAGARVDGRLVSLKHQLKSGEMVEIITQKTAKPSIDWLEIVKTGRAQHHIRHWIKNKKQDESLRLGREMLERELKRKRAKVNLEEALPGIAQELGHQDADRLLTALGSGDLPLQKIVHRLVPEEPKKRKLPLPDRFRKAFQRSGENSIKIDGLDHLMISFARCCQPVPGDSIKGIVTVGRGVSIHRADCQNLQEGRVDSDRLVEVSWDVGDETTFPVQLTVTGHDRMNLLADISHRIGELQCNIQAGSFEGTHDFARCSFVVEVRNLRHLNQIMNAIQNLSGVIRVDRSAHLREDELGELDLEI